MLQLFRHISSLITGGKRIIKTSGYGRDDTDTRTANECSPAGLDCAPAGNLRAVYCKTTNDSIPVVVGYINTAQLSEPGDSRLFSTNANGNLITYIWLHNATGNGQIELGGTTDNAVGYTQLAVQFNELNIKFNNLVAAFNAHVHAGIGIPPTPVAGVIPALPSVADISTAKNEKIVTI